MEYSQIQLLIVDDHALFRKTILRSLKDDPRIKIVGIASNGQQALTMCRELQPHVVLSDLHMSGLDGFQLIQSLAAFDTHVPAVMVMTGDDSVQSSQRAFDAGASGFLLKDNVTEESLVSAIYALSDGGIYIDPQVFAHLKKPSLVIDQRERIRKLNSAEHELLRVVALGYDNKQIAQLLSVSSKTVSNRLSMLYGLIGVSNRVQAANLTYRAGVVKPHDVIL